MAGGVANTAPYSIFGNAATATTLQSARTVQTNLASTAAVSFDGSENVAPGVTGMLEIANGGTGATTAANAATSLGFLPVNSTTTAPSGTTRRNFNGYFYATRVYGSVYQDYAECREHSFGANTPYPGSVVVDVGGKMELPCLRRHSNAFIVSDTYGQLLGVVDDIPTVPVGLSGRLLAFVETRIGLRSGDFLGTSKRKAGCLSRMSKFEAVLNPGCIVGVVSEIPEYTVWNGINVCGRVWVSLK